MNPYWAMLMDYICSVVTWGQAMNLFLIIISNRRVNRLCIFPLRGGRTWLLIFEEW